MIFLVSVIEGDYTLALHRADLDSELFIYTIRKCGHIKSCKTFFANDIETVIEWYAMEVSNDITDIKEGRL